MAVKFSRGRSGVGVGRVAHHQHLDVAAGAGVQGTALGGEDLRVGGQQIGTLHARAARAGAHKQRVVGALERGHRVAVRLHAREQREGAVVEFHHHALERVLRLLVGDLQQLQDHRLVLAEHLAAGDAEQQGIADLAGGAGDGHADGLLGGAHGQGLLEVAEMGGKREAGEGRMAKAREFSRRP
jgi:hypothetical protein